MPGKKTRQGTIQIGLTLSAKKKTVSVKIMNEHVDALVESFSNYLAIFYLAWSRVGQTIRKCPGVALACNSAKLVEDS